MELNLKPACVVFWSTVVESLSYWVVNYGVPVYLLSEPSNLVDKQAVMLAVKVVDLFEFLGVQQIVPGMPDDSPMVRIGYLMRLQDSSCEEKSVYFQALQIHEIIEGRLNWEEGKIVFKTLARIQWEIENFPQSENSFGF